MASGGAGPNDCALEGTSLPELATIRGSCRLKALLARVPCRGLFGRGRRPCFLPHPWSSSSPGPVNFPKPPGPSSVTADLLPCGDPGPGQGKQAPSPGSLCPSLRSTLRIPASSQHSLNIHTVHTFIPLRLQPLLKGKVSVHHHWSSPVQNLQAENPLSSAFPSGLGFGPGPEGTPANFPILVTYLPTDPTAGQRGRWKLPSVGGLLCFLCEIKVVTPFPPSPAQLWDGRDRRVGRGTEAGNWAGELEEGGGRLEEGNQHLTFMENYWSWHLLVMLST